jgi:hypothetical protein
MYKHMEGILLDRQWMDSKQLNYLQWTHDIARPFYLTTKCQLSENILKHWELGKNVLTERATLQTSFSK